MRITLTQYSELERKAKGFESGILNLLVIDGPWGVGKSHIMQETMDRIGGLTIRGYKSPAAFFNAIRDFANKPILIDDVDKLLQNKDLVLMLKQLCDTKKIRTVERETMHSEVQADNAHAAKFETTSPVCVITNSTGTDNPNLLALFDRGYVVDFRPSFETIHRKAGEWFKDEEIYNYVGQNLPFATDLSFRLYENAAKTKQLGDDWIGDIESHWGSRRFSILKRCVRDNPGDVEDQAFAYRELTGKARATFFRDKRALLELSPKALDIDILGKPTQEANAYALIEGIAA